MICKIVKLVREDDKSERGIEVAKRDEIWVLNIQIEEDFCDSGEGVPICDEAGAIGLAASVFEDES